MVTTALSPQQEQLLLLEREKELRRTWKIKYLKLQKWQKDVLARTVDRKEIWVSKANRTGGTCVAAYFVAACAGGIYDDLIDPWEWRRFSGPVRVLVIGTTFDDIKIASQKILVGEKIDKEKVGVGAIGKVYPLLPHDLIGDFKMNQDNPGCIDHMFVKHVSGDYSVIYFRSQIQDAAVIMGDEYDIVWPDEFAENESFYDQARTRTWTTKGLIFMTATPERGKKSKNIVHRFHHEKPEFNGVPITYYREVNLWEAEHFTKEEADAIEAQTPEPVRPFRLWGKPIFGKGFLYPTPDDFIKIPIEQLPNPKNCEHIIGLDWGRADAGALSWLMRESGSDQWIVWRVRKFKDLSPTEVANQFILPIDRQIGMRIKVMWDHYARVQDFSGNTVYQEMRDCGVNMYNVRCWNSFIKNANQGDRQILDGVLEMRRMMKEDQLKVVDSPDTSVWFEEKNDYYLDEDGEVVKKKNARFDVMDSTRHAGIMLRYAESFKSEITVSRFAKTSKSLFNVN